MTLTPSRFRRAMVTKMIVACVSVIAIAACGSSDSTTGPAGPTNANVAGSWNYSATNLTGGGVSCSVSGTVMTFTQAGATFSGTYSGGTLICGAPGVPNQTAPIGSGTIASGTVSINNVSFNFDTSDWQNTGAISGNTIAGTAVVRTTDGSTTTLLTGNFSATKR